MWAILGMVVIHALLALMFLILACGEWALGCYGQSLGFFVACGVFIAIVLWHAAKRDCSD